MPETLASEVVLEKVRAPGVLFSVKRPVRIVISQRDGSWYCESGPLSILSSGATLQEALNSFQEDFAVLWEEIAQSRDEDLTVRALAVKRAFLDLVSGVEVV